MHFLQTIYDKKANSIKKSGVNLTLSLTTGDLIGPNTSVNAKCSKSVEVKIYQKLGIPQAFTKDSFEALTLSTLGLFSL